MKAGAVNTPSVTPGGSAARKPPAKKVNTAAEKGTNLKKRLSHAFGNARARIAPSIDV